jgi:glycosyltransferase involved in cell wall biosynthesis
LVYNSQTTRTAVEALVGPHRPGVVAYPGGDHLPPTLTPKQIEARAREPGPLRILFVGNLTPVKGLHTLLQALTSLPPQTWCLTVLGSLTMDPVYVDGIRRQIARSGLTDHVRLLGTCPNTAVGAHLAWHQVLAVPSLYEAFGIAYLEALSFGLPVLGSTAGAAHELITDGEHGYLVTPGDAVTLGRRLLRLHRAREDLRRMGLAAYRRAQQHPSWSESAGRVRELLQTLVR